MQDIMTLMQDPTAWIALATLVVMEVVLGIDNLIFISILTNKLPPEHRERARRIGIGLALVMRLGLLGTIAWIVKLTTPVFELFGRAMHLHVEALTDAWAQRELKLVWRGDRPLSTAAQQLVDHLRLKA